jgi:hypothetical protein
MSGGSSGLWAGCPVAFLTRHGKQTLVREPLERGLGVLLVHTEAFDTDLLGTFTREVARPGSQLEAARHKARVGMELTGTTLAIAGEGSFGPDPWSGLVAWDTELLLWSDPARELEVCGLAQGPAQSLMGVVTSVDSLTQLADSAGFPGHRLVLRPCRVLHWRIPHGVVSAILDLASGDCHIGQLTVTHQGMTLPAWSMKWAPD